MLNASVLGREAAEWAWRQVDEAQADIVVLCGNHVFRWAEQMALLRPNAPTPLVHPNALNFISIESSRLLLLADETEFGRQLYEVFLSCSAAKASIQIATLLCDKSPRAVDKRNRSIAFLRSRGSEASRFADALEAIRAWKSFDTDREFHRYAVTGVAEEMRRRPTPFNSDATLLSVRGVSPIATLVETLTEPLRRHGTWYQSTPTTATLILDGVDLTSAMRNHAGVAVQRIRALCKFFVRPDHEDVVISPMVYADIRAPETFADDAVAHEDPASLSIRVMRAGLSRATSVTTEQRGLIAYDLMSLALDIELAKFLVSVWPSDVTLAMDHYSLEAYYGRTLADDLRQLVQAELSSPRAPRQVSAVDSPSPTSEDADTPNPTIDKLMLCKLETYNAFNDANRGIGDPILRHRAGLSAGELEQRTGLPRDAVACCVDALCDLEWTEPFNRRTSVGRGHMVLERCYNSTQAGLTSFMVQILHTLHRHGMPTHLTFLNKYVSFLIQTSPTASAASSGVSVHGYYFGKRVTFKVDEMAEEVLLHRFLDLSPGLFGKDGDKYEVRPGVDKVLADDGEPCFEILSQDILEAELEKLVEIYGVITSKMKHRGSGVADRSVDHLSTAFAVFVDMLGNEYPESGFMTIATNLRLAQTQFQNRKYQKAKEHLAAMRTKVQAIRHWEPVLRGIYDNLRPRSGFPSVDRILGRFSFLPENSPIWVLIETDIGYAWSAPQKKDAWAPLREFAQLLAGLGCERVPWQQRETPADRDVQRYLVSVDMRKSKEVSKIPLGEHWKSYTKVVAGVWAYALGGEFINHVGDESIHAFEQQHDALAFAGAVWYHLNGFCDAVLPVSGFGIGIAHGRIIRRVVQGRSSVGSGAEVPFDAIAVACGLSKDGRRIQEDTGRGQEKREHTPHELFEKYIVARRRERWLSSNAGS